MQYKHIKTGRVYNTLHIAIDCTNGAGNKNYVVYQSVISGEVYVRESKEFLTKFKEIKCPAKPVIS